MFIALILLPTGLEFPCGRGYRIIHGSDAAPFPVHFLLGTLPAGKPSDILVRLDNLFLECAVILVSYRHSRSCMILM
jgi:hypothetical protein